MKKHILTALALLPILAIPVPFIINVLLIIYETLGADFFIVLILGMIWSVWFCWGIAYLSNR